VVRGPGTLDGRPYAESGREVYDGQGGIVLTYSVSAECIGAMVYPDGQKATSFISPDGSRFTYTITAAPGSKGRALSGMEIRVVP